MIRGLRGLLHREIVTRAQSSRALRSAINKIAVEQGFIGFVEDIDFAVAGQMGYRLIGQILFYFALRRKQVALKPLTMAPGEDVSAALHPYWEDVRRYDYDALFKPHPLDSLVPIPVAGQQLVRILIEQLAAYDWASLSDVLGQYASQIQRQHFFEFSHNQEFLLGICFLIECHHASDYLERCLCNK